MEKLYKHTQSYEYKARGLCSPHCSPLQWHWFPGTAAQCGDTREEHLIPTKKGWQGRGPVLSPPLEGFQCQSLFVYTLARKTAE